MIEYALKYALWFDENDATALVCITSTHRGYFLVYIFFESMFFSSIFSSIVVSISACHHNWQLAGDRGSIPRWRAMFFLPFFAFWF